MVEGGEGPSIGAQETTQLLEAISGFTVFQRTKKNLKEAPLRNRTKDWVRRGIGEYLREFGSQKARTALVNMWEGKAILLEPNLTPDEIKEVRKTLGALQDSVSALKNGRPEKFNEKIAGRLVERFEERARTARTAGNEEEAETLLQAAEEYRDLQGVLLKEITERKKAESRPKKRPESVKVLPALPELKPHRTGAMRELLDNLRILRDYVETRFGKLPEETSMMGESREEFESDLRRRGFSPDTVIFYDEVAEHWVVGPGFNNEKLATDPEFKERVVRSLMGNAQPKDSNLSPNRVKFATS